MKAVIAAAALLLLAACSTAAPKIVGVAPPGIAYRVDNGDTSATAQRADQYCAAYGKHATLQGVSDSGGARIAQYACS